MALPVQKQTINDLFGTAWHDHIREWMSWYSGDSQSILNHYASSNGGFFVNSQGEATFAQRKSGDWVHMPIAADIAAISAALLFSESPKISLPEGEGKDRWDGFYRENNIPSKLLEAAEIAAAGGGVYLKLYVDADLSEFPRVDVVAPVDVNAKFRSGSIVDYTQSDIVRFENNGETIYRVVESRTRGANGSYTLETGVYKGNKTDFGTRIDPADLVETAYLVGKESLVLTKEVGIGVIYIPNVLPNRLNTSMAEGVSDFHGLVSLLDALDDAYTAWMKDIEMGRGKVLVDKELLKHGDFDTKQDYFVKMQLDESKFGGAHGYKPYEVVQFDLRSEQHKLTCLHLIEQIVDRAGYSPASFGMAQEGKAESGTALRIRERKSMLTRAKKGNYWSDGIRKFIQAVWAWDVGFGLSSGYEAPDPTEITVDIQDSIIPEGIELAQTAQAMRGAEAASTQTLVAMMHPEWTTEQIDEEVKRIKSEGATITVPQEFGNEPMEQP